jgi:ABC-type multidrug transport system ATPase subunit
MSIAVQADRLSKSFDKGRIKAVKGVSFEVNEGEIFGIIGPDGAGKTTLFRMLTTLYLPDSGNATVIGFDVVKDYKQIRQKAGYMPGKFSLYPDLTVKENLHSFASVFNTTVKANYHLIEDIYIQIAPFENRRAGKLSGGMKQKLALCCALIHSPSILFLDEPTTGVDPISRKEFWVMLKRLKEQHITIVVSTPYMDEADQCDRIALMQEGEILSVNNTQNIVADYPDQLHAIKANNTFQLLNSLRNYEKVLSVYAFGEYAHVSFKGRLIEKELRDHLAQQGLKDIEFTAIAPTIEDCFIKLLNKHEDATDQ